MEASEGPVDCVYECCQRVAGWKPLPENASLSPSFLPHLSNNKDSRVSSQLKLAFLSFGSGASTGMNKQGSVSL